MMIDVRQIETSEFVQNELRKHHTIQDENLKPLFNEIKEESILLLSKYEGISLSELRDEIYQKFDFSNIDIDTPTNWTYDIYNQYERIGINEVRKRLGLVFARYEGGLIDDSRPFCIERNRKIFHISEIESWANDDWDGKNEIGYNPLIDLGGYGCRHRLRWITKETAAAIRPEIRTLFAFEFI